MRKKNRTLYLLTFRETEGSPKYEWLRASKLQEIPCDKRARRILEMMLSFYNQDSDKKKLSQGVESTGLLNPNDFDLFDWSGTQLPKNLLVEEVPRPGVLVAVKSLPSSEWELIPLFALGNLQKMGAADSLLSEFLVGEDADFEPMPVCEYDVFISYSAKDSALASEIQDLLREQNLNCFLAEKVLQAGRVWNVQIREALIASRVGVLVLTLNSVTSEWVMCEVGAFWALEKPIVPACISLDVRDIPELIAEYPFRKIETLEERIEFITEIKRLCWE